VDAAIPAGRASNRSIGVRHGFVAKFPPRGRDGGRPGKPAYLGLKTGDRQLECKGTQEIPAGERLILRTPGGGLGDPRRRDAATIAADLKNGLVSPESTRANYGRGVKTGFQGADWRTMAANLDPTPVPDTRPVDHTRGHARPIIPSAWSPPHGRNCSASSWPSACRRAHRWA
jgi:hypothetical protein